MRGAQQAPEVERAFRRQPWAATVCRMAKRSPPPKAGHRVLDGCAAVFPDREAFVFRFGLRQGGTLTAEAPTPRGK